MSSCTLKPAFKLANEQLSTIQAFLFPEGEDREQALKKLDNDDEPSEESDSENSQGTEAPSGVNQWLDNEMESSEKSEIEGENNEDSKWLRSCLVSISPFLDFVVLAAVQRLVACSKSSKSSNNLSIDCLLKVAEDNDYIASIFVLPISSTRKSEASIVDWHCIIVGLSSGHLQFYTERGVLIFSEHVSTHPIKMIRFNSSVCAGNQELAVLAQNRFIVIEGLSLFTTLKTARSSIARGDRTVSELSSTLELNFSVFQPDSLRGLYDFQVVGSVKPSYVETYTTAARDSGSNSKVSRSSLPTYSSYFCINKDAFGAFSWHDRNPSTNPLSDALQTITNQISNAVPLPSFGFRSLFGIGVSRRDLPRKKSAFDASVIRLPIRTTLKDDGRIADRTYFAPEPWNLMAVTDENARILLINTESRRVIRIWKGYRNARCAWVESQGKTSKKTNQAARALFLAIFAPRRGLLEIWLMENGPRVGQFNVDRSGKLLPISSAKDAVLGYQANSFPTNLNSLSALFVSPNGLSLIVPFYLAATDASATVLHDEHLLKEFQLNTLIKKHRLDMQKWLDFVDSLKSISAKKKCVEALWKSDKVDVDCVYEVLEKHRKTWQKPNLHGSKIERSTFDLYLSALTSLIRAYSMLKNADDSSPLKEQEISMLNILEDLCLDEEEYESLAIPLLRKNLPSNDMPSRLSLSRFLDQFEIETIPKGTNEPSYQLKNNESDEFALSTLLFLPYVLKNGSIKQLFMDILPLLMIPEDKTLDLFCVFWLAKWNNDPFIYASQCCLILNRFYQLIIKSPKQVEDRMQSSVNVKAVLVFYLCLKSIKRKLAKDKGLPADVNEGVECMEVDESIMILDDDYFEWVDLLISHSNCLSLLDIVQKPQSLNNLIAQGYGYYRAQAGLWLANGVLTVSEVFGIVSQRTNETPNPSTLTETKIVARDVLRALSNKFPLSFQAELFITDCIWESACLWYKDESRKTSKLKMCLDFLELNSSHRLQHGIALMLWDTFVSQPFKNLVTLLNRRGGACPPDRITRRECLVVENELLDFVLCVKRLLQVLCSSVVDLELQPNILEDFEDFIESFFEHLSDSGSKRKLLSEAAAGQKSVNYHLCLHHLHLATVLELQLTLGIKNRPEILFDQIGIRAFFEPFHSHPLIPLGNKDVSEMLRYRRQTFLEKCIQSVGVTADSQYFQRWETALVLASEWQLNVDSCRTKEILMLYENNFDEEAANIIPLIHDRKMLAGELISLIAIRLRNFFEQDPPLYDRIVQNSLATPETLDYINSFVESPIPASGEQIQTLIRHTKTLLITTSSSSSGVSKKLSMLKELEQINNLILNSSNTSASC